MLRLPRNMQLTCRKRCKSIPCATQSDFQCSSKHARKLPIGTAVATSRRRLLTVANGCATSSKHTRKPQTTRVNREPLLGIREPNCQEEKLKEGQKIVSGKMLSLCWANSLLNFFEEYCCIFGHFLSKYLHIYIYIDIDR